MKPSKSFIEWAKDHSLFKVWRLRNRIKQLEHELKMARRDRHG